MRICFYWARVGPYHAARFLAVKESNKNSFLVQVSDTDPTYGWSIFSSADVWTDTLFKGRIAPRGPFFVFGKIAWYLYSKCINVLFVPSYWPANSLVAAVAAKLLGINLVFMTDSHENSGKNNGIFFLIKKLLITLYDSAFVAGGLHRQYACNLGFSSDRILEGYDVVDNTYFNFESARALATEETTRSRLFLPNKYILSLGRFVEKKNLSTILSAYADLVRSGLNAGHALVFVGSGPVKSQLFKLADAYKLCVVDHMDGKSTTSSLECGGIVHFLPFAQIDTVPAFYALASGFVLASTTEEWGLVVNEAMASGCPTLVSSAVGCAPDLVEDGKTGYIFDPNDVATLSDRMARLCGDEQHAKEMGRAAQRKIDDWSCHKFANNALLAARAAAGNDAETRVVI